VRAEVALVVATALLAVGCSDGGSASESTVRVPVSVLRDPTDTLPEDAGGVDLGALGPASGLTFCEAFAAVRTDWVNGAIVPLQWWIDAYAEVEDEPDDAAASLAALREFADLKLAWNLKRVDSRPVYDEDMAREAVVLADAAAAACPDLPLVVGPNPSADPPDWWADESDAAVATMCRDDAAGLAVAIDAYVERNGRQPLHQEQVYADAFVAWAYGDAELFVGSEYFGIRLDDDGSADVVPVPGGACAR